MTTVDTYLKTPVRCQRLLAIESIESLFQYREVIAQSDKRVIIGETSNILFTQDFPGVVIKNAVQGKINVKTCQNRVLLTVPAGINWHQLVQLSVDKGWWGIENLALIPGLVGSAPIQNIGAYGVELSDCKPTVYGIDLTTMQRKVFTLQECQFSYRDSIFKTHMVNDFFIYALSLELNRDYHAQLDYAGLWRLFKGKKPNQRQVMEAVCHIRKNKLPDPQQEPNIGSFFKNPLMSQQRYTEGLQHTPRLANIPAYKAAGGSMFKLSAAALIEQSGLKGYQHTNGTKVSSKHALVLTNPLHRQGQAIVELAELIQHTVQQQYRIRLQPEIRMIA